MSTHAQQPRDESAEDQVEQHAPELSEDDLEQAAGGLSMAKPPIDQPITEPITPPTIQPLPIDPGDDLLRKGS